jgi:hypothetical protein
MNFLQLNIYILEQIIPRYLNLKDKVNYFRALNWLIPERFLISHIEKNKWEGLSKKKLFYELYFIKHNFTNMTNRSLEKLEYHHWLYISACLSLEKSFVLKYRNKLILSALVNNLKININFWLIDRKNLDMSFKLFNCWICKKKFTTYKPRGIKNTYYLHYCYRYCFETKMPKTIRTFFKIYRLKTHRDYS